MPFRNAYYVILICKSHCTLCYRPVNLTTITTVRPYSLFQNMGPFHDSVWLRWTLFKSLYEIICMTLCRWFGNILMSKVLVSLLPRFASYYHVFDNVLFFNERWLVVIPLTIFHWFYQTKESAIPDHGLTVARDGCRSYGVENSYLKVGLRFSLKCSCSVLFTINVHKKLFWLEVGFPRNENGVLLRESRIFLRTTTVWIF